MAPYLRILPLHTFIQRQRIVARDPRFAFRDPVMKNRRLAKVAATKDPIMQCVANSPCFLAAIKRSAKAGQVLKTGRDVQRFSATQLHASVDGRVLRQQRQTPTSTDGFGMALNC